MYTCGVQLRIVSNDVPNPERKGREILGSNPSRNMQLQITAIT